MAHIELNLHDRGELARAIDVANDTELIALMAALDDITDTTVWMREKLVGEITKRLVKRFGERVIPHVAEVIAQAVKDQRQEISMQQLAAMEVKGHA